MYEYTVLCITYVTRYCNVLRFGITNPVKRYYLPEVTL